MTIKISHGGGNLYKHNPVYVKEVAAVIEKRYYRRIHLDVIVYISNVTFTRFKIKQIS